MITATVVAIRTLPMPFKKFEIYRVGARKSTPFILHDGIVKLYVDSPYDGHPVVVGWVKPGDYFGEEFAFGQPAMFNALAVRNHTWAQDVVLPPEKAMELVGNRMQKLIDISLVGGMMRHGFRIQFLFNLLNLPFPDIYQSELLETCGKISITKREIAHAYRKQGLFEQRGKKVVVSRPDLVAQELERVIADVRTQKKVVTGRFFGKRHIAPKGPRT